MKYIYFLFIYFLVALAKAEETVSLEGKLPKCECRDIIDEILCKLTENSEKVLKIQAKLAKVVKETNEILTEAKENSAQVKEIVSVSTLLKSQVNSTVTVVTANTAAIIQIKNQVHDHVLDNGGDLEQTLIGSSCKLNQIRRVFIGLGNCQCRKPDTDEANTEGY